MQPPHTHKQVMCAVWELSEHTWYKTYSSAVNCTCRKCIWLSLTDYWIFIRPISTVVYTITNVHTRDADMILAPETESQLFLSHLWK
jgi:hypothetical protein